MLFMENLAICFEGKTIHSFERNEESNLKKLVAFFRNCKSLGWLKDVDVTDDTVYLHVCQRYHADTAKLSWEYLLHQKEDLFMKVLHLKVNGSLKHNFKQDDGIDPKKVEDLIKFCAKNKYLQYIEYIGDRNNIIDINLHNEENVEPAIAFWNSLNS